MLIPAATLTVLRIRISIIFQDPDPFPGVLATLINTTKLTRRENLNKYDFWLGPVGLLTGKIKLRCIKSTVLGTLPL
jgi:hypothetical protein